MEDKTVWIGKRIWRAAKNSRIEIVFLVTSIGTVIQSEWSVDLQLRR